MVSDKIRSSASYSSLAQRRGSSSTAAAAVGSRYSVSLSSTGAPTFGNVRITQSEDRDLDTVTSTAQSRQPSRPQYGPASGSRSSMAAPPPPPTRRYSVSTDKIYNKDYPMTSETTIKTTYGTRLPPDAARSSRQARAASLSRFENKQPSYSFSSLISENDMLGSNGYMNRVPRVETTTSYNVTDSQYDDDDASYELRKQLRAIRSQQIKTGNQPHFDSQDAINRARSPSVGPPRPGGFQRSRANSMGQALRGSSVSRAMSRERQLSTAETTATLRRSRASSVVSSRSDLRTYSVPSTNGINGHATTTPDVNQPEPTLFGQRLPNGSNISVDIDDSHISNGQDITAFVLKPGEKFLPTDVSVKVLPSGKKAVTYTRFSQKGTGDQRNANAEIEKIVQKTKHLQDTMKTLEDFVKRNRSLFPEDIIIYQKIMFYLLSEEELIKMGERPDAEVYGVKICEKLVAPIGSDVASILKRYYSKYKEVDVEYQEKDKIKRQLELEMRQGQTSKTTTTIEEETELESRRKSRAQPAVYDWSPMAQRYPTSDKTLYIDEVELFKESSRSHKKPEDIPALPIFTSRLRPQRVTVGHSVRFTCSVSGIPDPEVTWYRGNRELDDSGRFIATVGRSVFIY